MPAAPRAAGISARPRFARAQLAAMVRMDAGDAVAVRFHGLDPYRGGRTLLTCTALDGAGDAASGLTDPEFEATFVGSMASAPEPSMWTPVGAALVDLGGVAAGRKRRNG